jgi:hypothetical protein
MWCSAQFATFNERIKLDLTRRNRIDSAISAFVSFCREDEQLSVAMSENPFLQGSVHTKTAIKPLTGDEFDVDVIYPFSLWKFQNAPPSPKGIIDWFISRLKNRQFYAERLIPKNRCARINYAGDFHLDIIPSTREVAEHQPYAVPARDLGSWITNDPRGFAEWVQTRDVRSGGIDTNGDGRFVRCIRMMKRWRDQFFGEQSAVSSILLVTILGKHDPTVKTYSPPLQNSLFPQYQTDAAYLYDMLCLTYSCLQGRIHQSTFHHPTIQDEDLARGWDETYLRLFLERLQKCIDHIQKGIYAQTDAESLLHYGNAFGSTFPKQ